MATSPNLVVGETAIPIDWYRTMMAVKDYYFYRTYDYTAPIQGWAVIDTLDYEKRVWPL